MMSDFSQIYVNSQFMGKLLENVPEAERGAVIEHLKSFMSQYDHLAAGGWEICFLWIVRHRLMAMWLAG